MNGRDVGLCGCNGSECRHGYPEKGDSGGGLLSRDFGCHLYPPNLLFKLLFPLAKNFINVNSFRKIHIIKSSHPDGIAHKLTSKYHFAQVMRENLLEEHGGTIELDQARRLVRDMSIEHGDLVRRATPSEMRSILTKCQMLR